MSVHEIDNNTIDVTQSLCPFCLKVLPAVVFEKDKQIYMKKTCPEHGEFNVYLWPDVKNYKWFSGFNMPAAPREPQTKRVDGCPLDCGLCPDHLRGIILAEIEVTWRCNLACPVCYLAAGDKFPDPNLEKIAGMLKTIRRFDKDNTCLQISGGEPTIRDDLPEIIALARQLGFLTIELNTNGLVIARDSGFLHDMKKAGLTNVYLQFDGVTPKATLQLRGADLLGDKLRAIDNCRREGLPVILSSTVVSGVNDGQMSGLVSFAMNNLDVILGLAIQPAFRSGRFDVIENKSLSSGDIFQLISEQSGGRIAVRDFWPVGCIHSLCAGSTYLVGEGEDYFPFTRDMSEDDFRLNFNSTSPQGSVILDMLARKYFDKDIPPGLPILVMSYMDAWKIDLKRLRECNLGVTIADGRTIPFCAYHLTDVQGNRLFPLGQGRVAGNGNP